MSKVCEGCGAVFEPSMIRQKYCCAKCRERTWVTNNRERLNETVRKYRARRYVKEGAWREKGPKVAALRQWMAELKSKPCVDCGQTFPICCMDFDHRDGEVKAYNLGSMFAHHYSVELITAELAKCDLVCSNCHRVRTQKRRTGHALAKNRALCDSEKDDTGKGAV